MTVEEIFRTIIEHMLKGIMTHEELANYYDFLGLKGYKKCHEYHYYIENCSYREFYHYYITHCSKLIPNINIEKPQIIPSSWYKHTREDVDTSTKRSAIKSGLEMWVNWEKETKTLYEQMYFEAFNTGHITVAMKIKQLICDVEYELEKAEKYALNKKAIDYDIHSIIQQQKEKYYKYEDKMHKKIMGEH